MKPEFATLKSNYYSSNELQSNFNARLVMHVLQKFQRHLMELEALI
jgi:hypothetical protein